MTWVSSMANRLAIDPNFDIWKSRFQAFAAKHGKMQMNWGEIA
jgi:hypothetical protein